jgi:hypothetical protein
MQQADHGHSANPVGKSTDNAEIFIGEPLRALYEAEHLADYVETLLSVGERLLHEAIEQIVFAQPAGAKPDVRPLGEVANLMGTASLLNELGRKQMSAADVDLERLRFTVNWRRAA